MPHTQSVDSNVTVGSLSPLTQRGRVHSLRLFMSALAANGSSRTWDTVTAEEIDQYVQSQRGTVGARTLQNRVGHIRAHLREIGREQLADSIRLTSVALGISDVSGGEGLYQKLNPKEYELVIQRAHAIDPGFACALQLQRELGLRSAEAILCGPSLKRWAQALETLDRVLVIEGTKDNIHRQAIATQPYRALQAVTAAISALKPQGELLSASKQGYFQKCKKVGLMGMYCTEALRILYVQERYAINLQALGSRYRALRATCLDIGYGEERHKHVQKVFQL